MSDLRSSHLSAVAQVVVLFAVLFLVIGGSVGLAWHASPGWGVLVLGFWAVVAICAAA